MIRQGRHKKIKGKNGVTYQVRYPNKAMKSGYAFATFKTMKGARAFLESGKTRDQARTPHSEIRTVADATDLWPQNS